jgi:hypothetical protein
MPKMGSGSRKPDFLTCMLDYQTQTRESFGGGLFAHLRACRQLIQWLSDTQSPPRTADETYVFGLCQEIYYYLILANQIVFPGLLSDRDLPLEDDDVVANLSQLSQYPTFGLLFARCHGLWELIPQVALFGARRLAEERASPDSAALQSRAEHDRLRDRIISWRLPVHDEDSLDKRVAAQRRALGETLRLALQIFLECAMAGGPVPDDARVRILEHVVELGNQVLADGLDASPFETVLLWPVVVAGSCVTTEREYKLMMGKPREPDRPSWGGDHAAYLLEKVIRLGRKERDVYGPYGIYLVMERYGINYCVC